MPSLTAPLALLAAFGLLAPVGAAAQEDTAPPVLVDLDFFPRQIDTTTGDQRVTVVVEFLDDVSGISTPGFPAPCNFFGAGNVGCSPWALASGTILDGVLQAEVLFPFGSPLGDYRLVNLLLVDRVNNRLRLDDPSNLGFDTLLVNAATSPSDADGDGVPDIADNCLDNPNEDQSDADLDLIGDVCDPFPNDRDNEQAQCEADLGQCFVDLAACEDGTALGQCQADLATCDANLTEASADLGMCTSDLVQAQAQASECSADLGQCQLAEQQCGTDLGQCSSDLGVCDGERTLLSSDLDQCEGDLADLQAAQSDSDEDGMPDAFDTCPDTPAGQAVDQEGCSPEQFCSQFDVVFSEGRSQCKKADWRNDEPRMRSRERDCEIDRGSSGRGDDRCVPTG